MKLKIKERLKSVELRKRGLSLNEIVGMVGVAKSTVSTWVRNVPLNDKARKRLLTKIKKGQLVSAENKRRRTEQVLEGYRQQASKFIGGEKINNPLGKIICSLIYWCEGTKNHYTGVTFTNSDPRLVKTFLNLLRNHFDISEKKFRPCIHLHGYHNIQKQVRFWSLVTKIPRNQFIKPYLKPNTGKRIKDNYQGCISIKYHSTATARELLMTAEEFLSKYN